MGAETETRIRPSGGEPESRILAAYLANKSALKRFLRRFLKNAQDIDDIVQDTFLRAFAADAVETVAAPKAFLFSVARNLALNHLAKHANLLSDPMADSFDTAVLNSSDQVDIEDEVDARQRLKMLAVAVATLPSQCAKVFVMRKIHGYSQKEIAGQLGISESTVEKHVALGLVRCSEYLRQHGVEMGPKSVTRDPEGGVQSLRTVASPTQRRRSGDD